MKHRLYILLSLLVFSLIRCHSLSDVSETKNNSREIEQQSKHIADIEDKITYLGLEDNSIKGINQHYQELLAATDDSTRMEYAAEFTNSFRFQHWMGDYSDVAALYDDYKAEAMRMLFYFFDSMINHDYEVDRLPKRRWRQLAAVAGALDEINDDQIVGAKRVNMTAQSLYSIIVEGLRYDADYAAKKPVPKFAINVLKNKDNAIFFLQLRHNSLVAAMLGKLSNFNTGWLNEGLGICEGVDLKLAKQSANVEQGADWLDLAIQTQRDLLSLGYELRFNQYIYRVLERSTVHPISSFDNDPKGVENSGRLIKDKTILLNTFRDSRPPETKLARTIRQICH